MAAKKVSVQDLQACRDEDRKFTMLSIYDYPTALMADRAGIDAILVGDSLAMTVLGLPDTISVTLEECAHHTRAVARACERAMVVADMPFMSYQASDRDAVLNAGFLMKQGRGDTVKLEGGVNAAPRLAAIHRAGIPVMGHIGLTPQSAAQLGGMKLQGRDARAARALLDDALSLEEAGAFAIVLECVPAEVASAIDERLTVPTISYGAGPACTGQGMVSADMLGLFERFTPKFSKRYVDFGAQMLKAFEAFRGDVDGGTYPGDDHSYRIAEGERDALRAAFDDGGG